MIKFLHWLCRAGVALWTVICGFMAFGVFIKVSHGAASDTSGFAFFGLLVIGALWFFPTIFMVILAYFTRPQAWQESSKPLPTPVLPKIQ